MWVASWFSGIPSLGSKLLDTPKYLTHVLCHSRVCQSTLPRSSSPHLAIAAQNSLNFDLTASISHNHTQSSWLNTVEELLLSSSSNSHHLSEFLDSMQSLFEQLPVVAPSKDTASSVAIVEVTDDGTPLNHSESLVPRLGFWHCPTTKTASSGFQLWVKGCQIATVRDRASAQMLADQVTQLLEIPNLDATTLKAVLDNNQFAAKLGDRTIFTISDRVASRLGRPAELLAIEWVNNLRVALGQTSIPLAEAQIEMYQLAKTDHSIGGMASWYGPYFHGRQTANGEIFDQNELTAAHPTLPLGTFLKVTNRLNGKSVIVRINDRGPYFDNRVLDLSKRAARLLNSEERGIVPIEATVMESALIAQTKKPPQQVARVITGY
ncbi:septal ring lytic transglycosylase RlpA family protein [Leptolyngbya sp. DQ-M1]|uniref:septal ring lytic transglycosylase RlpA family protein n=1 Tax=Leptolyngbya sp. DQ-M1 TaxID=2933920 RepID=UPI0032997C4E